MLIPKDTDERVIYARRIVAGRCLYGMDKNPLACEMAKLSLWLLTLAKDMPFTFLDHAIRCGDSLVGISSTEQLEYYSLTPHSTPHTQHPTPNSPSLTSRSEGGSKRPGSYVGKSKSDSTALSKTPSKRP